MGLSVGGRGVIEKWVAGSLNRKSSGWPAMIRHRRTLWSQRCNRTLDKTPSILSASRLLECFSATVWDRIADPATGEILYTRLSPICAGSRPSFLRTSTGRYVLLAAAVLLILVMLRALLWRN